MDVMEQLEQAEVTETPPSAAGFDRLFAHLSTLRTVLTIYLGIVAAATLLLAVSFLIYRRNRNNAQVTRKILVFLRVMMFVVAGLLLLLLIPLSLSLFR